MKLLTAITCLLFHNTLAQNPEIEPLRLVVQGIVIDSAHQSPIGGASIQLQETISSQIIKSVASKADGTFELVMPYPSMEYHIAISHLGYKTKIILLSSKAYYNIEIGKIALAEKPIELDEVQVNTERPIIELDTDKLIYHVEADPESEYLTTLEVLRKVSLLTIDADENIYLNGRSNYQVLINGKRSSLADGNPRNLFKDLPASSVKKIEVITNPSSRHEAEGLGGIINIITYKKSLSGYNGAITLSAKSPRGYALNGNTAVSSEKINFSGHISHSISYNPTSRSSVLRENKQYGSRVEQNSEGKSNNSAQNFGGELNYDITPKDYLRFSYSRNQGHGSSGYTQLVEHIGSLNQVIEAYQNLNTTKISDKGNTLNIDYQHSFREDDQNLLSASVSFINNYNKSISDFVLHPVFNYLGRKSETGNIDSSKEYNIQLDYTQPLNKQMIEIGVKSILQQNNSNYFYKNKNQETGVFVLDSNLSNRFDYTLQVHAAYFAVHYRKNNWGLRAGTRIELTMLDANFRTFSTSAQQEYLNFFPNLSITRRFKNVSTAKLSYSQRIQRPDLYYLNPYVDLTDPQHISYGNPALLPATSHNIQLDFITQKKGNSITLGLFHNFTNNSIQYYTTLTTDSIAESTFDNLGENRNFGLSFNSNTTFLKKLNINLNGNTQHVKHYSTINGMPHHTNGFVYNMQGAFSWHLGRGWRANSNLGYNSGNVLVQGRTVGFIHNSLALSKEFLKNRNASLHLSVRNPLQHNRRSINELQSPSFYQIKKSLTVIRQFSLSFNYRFSRLNTQ